MLNIECLTSITKAAAKKISSKKKGGAVSKEAAPLATGNETHKPGDDGPCSLRSICPFYLLWRGRAKELGVVIWLPELRLS